ncbi:MAG: hypothetical protein QXT27_01705 [Pyrobaculum sp.]
MGKTITIRYDTQQLLSILKYRLGYRSYSDLIRKMLEDAGEINLSDVVLDTRERYIGHTTISLNDDVYEALDKIRRQYGYSFDTVLQKLMKAVGFV